MDSLPAIIGIIATILGSIAAVVQIADYLEKKRRKKAGQSQPAITSVTPGAAQKPMDSEGPAPTQPAPVSRVAEVAIPSAPFLQTFVGDDYSESPVRVVLEKLGPPTIQDFGLLPYLEQTGTWVYYNYYPYGISVSCNNAVIRAIHFYSGLDGSEFGRYPGELPFGIRWEDTRKDIESKLGPPDDVHVGPKAIEVEYRAIALSITYDRLYFEDQGAKMQHLVLQKLR